MPQTTAPTIQAAGLPSRPTSDSASATSARAATANVRLARRRSRRGAGGHDGTGEPVPRHAEPRDDDQQADDPQIKDDRQAAGDGEHDESRRAAGDRAGGAHGVIAGYSSAARGGSS